MEMEDSLMGIGQWLLLFGVFWMAIWGGFGSYIASQKGREDGEGMIFGAILGPIGLLVIAILPEKRPSEVKPAMPYEFKPRRMLGEVREDRSLRIN